jgi:hypothetical protein
LVICKESIKPETFGGYSSIRRLARKSDIGRQQKQRDIAEAIWKDAGKPCNKHEIWLDIPAPPTGKEGDFAFVRYPHDVPEESESENYKLRKLSESFPTETWANMYTEHKWKGHVFAPSDCLERVSKAAKKVLEDAFDLKFNNLAQTLCHLSPSN